MINFTNYLMIFVIICINCSYENLLDTQLYKKGRVKLGYNINCGYRFSDSELFSWQELETAKNDADIWLNDSISNDTSYYYSIIYKKNVCRIGTIFCPYLSGFFYVSDSYILNMDNDNFPLDSISAHYEPPEPKKGPWYHMFLFKTRDSKYGSFELEVDEYRNVSIEKDTINDTIQEHVTIKADSIIINYYFDR